MENNFASIQNQDSLWNTRNKSGIQLLLIPKLEETETPEYCPPIENGLRTTNDETLIYSPEKTEDLKVFPDVKFTLSNLAALEQEGLEDYPVIIKSELIEVNPTVKNEPPDDKDDDVTIVAVPLQDPLLFLHPDHIESETQDEERRPRKKSKLLLNAPNKKMKKAHNPCELCPDKPTFYRQVSLLNHIVNVHESPPTCKKTLRCPKCLKQFATEIIYKRHMYYHKHCLSKPLVCTICYTQFYKRDKDLLQRHMLYHNNNNNSFECTKCKATFELNIQLRSHERTEHPEIFIYECMICDKKYSQEKFLETHLNTHVVEEGPYLCTVCPFSLNIKTYTSTSSLAAHLRTHTGETCMDEYKCKICVREFATPFGLRQHLIVHEKEISRSCIYCDLELRSKKEYSKHVRQQHVNPMNGKFPCLMCGKSYVYMAGLNKHLKTIHQGKYHLCEVCGINFESAGLFMSHMKDNPGHLQSQVVVKLSCYFCDDRFSSEDVLQRHLSLHTSERFSKCRVCQKRFRTVRNYRNHKSKHFM